MNINGFKFKCVPARRSLTSVLELLVASERVWRPIKHLGVPTGDLLDLVVTETARSHLGTIDAAVQHLGDPATWDRLQSAVVAAFPNDPGRRLSPTPPTRHRHYAIRKRLTRDVIDEWRRGVRREAVDAARHIGLFNPTRGTWTHPDPTQCVVADMTWISAHIGPDRMVAPTDGNRVVMLSTGGVPDPIILDAELPDHNDYGADRAVAMLGRLLDACGATLRDGLRAVVHDMSMTAANVDDVLAMHVLPITKVRRRRGGGLARGRLGMHRFTAPDGTPHNLVVHAIGGAPAVALNHNGRSTVVALDRRRLCWAASGGRRVIARGRYAIPCHRVVPVHLRGATTVIRLASTPVEIQARPDTRRTRCLRPIPESDPDFERLYGAREDLEASFAVLRDRVGRPCGSHELRLRLLVHQIVSIERALAARNGN